MDIRPVGVMDSGVGGISVLRTLVKLMPDEHFIYLGDTKNAPYGDKSEETIRSLAFECADFLVKKDVKALVVACNTATSAAVQDLRNTLTIPVIGMEPALKPAALSGRPGKTLVMATTATLRQRKFQDLMLQYGQDAVVLPCPGLMEFAERGEIDSPRLDAYLKERMAETEKENISSVVLGCTHYVFLKKAVMKALPGVVLYDGNLGTAKRLHSVLRERDQLSPGPGKIELFSTENGAVKTMERLLRLPETDEESIIG